MLQNDWLFSGDWIEIRLLEMHKANATIRHYCGNTESEAKMCVDEMKQKLHDSLLTDAGWINSNCLEANEVDNVKGLLDHPSVISIKVEGFSSNENQAMVLASCLADIWREENEGMLLSDANLMVTPKAFWSLKKDLIADDRIELQGKRVNVYEIPPLQSKVEFGFMFPRKEKNILSLSMGYWLNSKEKRLECNLWISRIKSTVKYSHCAFCYEV